MCLLDTLRCVSLRGCEGVTDDGVAALAALPRLSRLVLRCARARAPAGWRLLRAHSSLCLCSQQRLPPPP